MSITFCIVHDVADTLWSVHSFP